MRVVSSLSKYNTTLREIIDSGFDIGLMNYPIFDETHRQTLNDKIVQHYYFNEISGETAYRFKFDINVALDEIMPKYNKMYEAELLKIDPLFDFRSTENSTISTAQEIENTTTLDNTTTSVSSDKAVVDSDVTQTTTVENASTSDGRTISSDTPQTELLIGDVETNLYATEANVTKDQTTTDENGSSVKDEVTTTDTTNTASNSTDTETTSNTDNDTLTTSSKVNEGFNRSQAELMKIYRDTLVDIDTLIFEDEKIRDCFMYVY